MVEGRERRDQRRAEGQALNAAVLLVGGETTDVAKTLLEVDDELAVKIGQLDKTESNQLAEWIMSDLELAAGAASARRASATTR